MHGLLEGDSVTDCAGWGSVLASSTLAPSVFQPAMTYRLLMRHAPVLHVPSIEPSIDGVFGDVSVTRLRLSSFMSSARYSFVSPPFIPFLLSFFPCLYCLLTFLGGWPRRRGRQKLRIRKEDRHRRDWEKGRGFAFRTGFLAWHNGHLGGLGALGGSSLAVVLRHTYVLSFVLQLFLVSLQDSSSGFGPSFLSSFLWIRRRDELCGGLPCQYFASGKHTRFSMLFPCQAWTQPPGPPQHA